MRHRQYLYDHILIFNRDYVVDDGIAIRDIDDGIAIQDIQNIVSRSSSNLDCNPSITIDDGCCHDMRLQSPFP